MKQPEDKRTIELSLEQQKRGRGRPAKADALTPAQRAKRYRDAKRAGPPKTVKRDVTERKPNVSVAMDQVTIESLRLQLSLTEGERNAAMRENTQLKEAIADLERDLHNANVVGMVNSDVSNENADRNIALQKKFDLEHHALVNALTKIGNLEAAVKTPKVNPLTAEVRKLKKELTARDAKHAAIIRAMRDEYDVRTKLAASRK